MLKKYCPKCETYSYSASNCGNWECPNCNYDLTKQPVMNLSQKKEPNTKLNELVDVKR